MKEKYYTDYEYIAASAYFDAKWYRVEYPDVVDVWGGDLCIHYLEYGWKEHRHPSPYFDGDRYLILYGKYMENGKINPLIHYERIGKDAGIVPPSIPYIVIKKSPFLMLDGIEKPTV